MLRSKRRRTKMHDSNGNPIFNTNNATSKETHYVMKNNYLSNKCCDKQINKKVNCKVEKEDILIINGFEGNFSFVNGHYYISGYKKVNYNIQGAQVNSPIYTNLNNKNITIQIDSVYTGFGNIQMWSSTQINNYSIKISYCSSSTSTACAELGPLEFYKNINPSVNYIQNWEYTLTPGVLYPNIKVLSSEITYTYTENKKLVCIKKTIERNPILGYRKQLKDCENCDIPKKPTNDVYKDNYAKTCGKFRKEDSSLGKFCAYNNVILPKQNNNGIIDASYNYSTSQYLSRPIFMKCNNVYKKSNPRFSTQGAVSGGSRLNRLKYQTIIKSQQKVYESEENQNVSNNKINGEYPTNLYRSTRPIYKRIYSTNYRCMGRSVNGLLQYCPTPK